MARKVQQCTGSIVRDVALYLGSGNGNGTVVVDQGAPVLLPPGAKRRRSPAQKVQRKRKRLVTELVKLGC